MCLFNMLPRNAPKVFVIVITPDADSHTALRVNMLLPIEFRYHHIYSGI